MSSRDLPEDVVYKIVDEWEPFIPLFVEIRHLPSIAESIEKGNFLFSPETFLKPFSDHISRTVLTIDFVLDNVLRPEEQCYSELRDDKFRMSIFDYLASTVQFLCAAVALGRRSKLRKLRLTIAAESEACRAVLAQVAKCDTIEELVVFQESEEDENILASALVQLPNLQTIEISSASRITLTALSRSRSKNVRDLKIGRLNINALHEFRHYIMENGKLLRELVVTGYTGNNLPQDLGESSVDAVLLAQRYMKDFFYYHAKTYMPKLYGLEVDLNAEFSSSADISAIELCSSFFGYADLLLRMDSLGTVLHVPNSAERIPMFTEIAFSESTAYLLREWPALFRELRVLHLPSECSMSMYASSAEMRDSVNQILRRNRTCLDAIACSTCPAMYESPQTVFHFLSGILTNCGSELRLKCSASLLKHFNEERNREWVTLRRRLRSLSSVELFRQTFSCENDCSVHSKEDLQILEGLPYFLQFVIQAMPGLSFIMFSRAPDSVCQFCKRRLKTVLEDAIVAVRRFSDRKRRVDVRDLYSELVIWRSKCD